MNESGNTGRVARSVLAVASQLRRPPRPIGDADSSDEGRGRVALVTGGSAGIGWTMCELLAAKGFNVVPVARRMDRLERLATQLKERWGVRVDPIAADLGDPAACRQIVSTLAERDLRIDVLVNNAGYAQPGLYLHRTWDDQHFYLQVLAVSCAELTHRLLPGMVERGWGRVINVSSIGGLLAGAPGQALYAASKAFLVKLSESIAAEYERHGVRSTVALLGPTQTEFNEVAGLTAYFDEHPVMKMWTMAPEPVVRRVYEASARGRRVVVPGIANRAAAALFVHTPPRVRYALSRLAADTGQPDASTPPTAADPSSAGVTP